MPPPPIARQPCLVASGPVLVFGGLYSNLQATEALFAAASGLGIPPERMICMGDVVAYGADPAECVRLLRRSGVTVVAGHCEKQLGASAAACDCDLAPISTFGTRSLAWFAHASRSLTDEDRAWMRALSTTLTLQIGVFRLLVLPDGLDGPSKFVWPSDGADLDRQLGRVDADGVIGGHCGLPFTRIGPAGLWHNPGVIGMPANDGTPRGWYSVLTPGPAALTLSHHALSFDAAGAAGAIRAAGLPPGYADAIETGLWPACDVLPPAELSRRGVRYTEGSLNWVDDVPAAWPEPTIPAIRERFTDPLITLSGKRRAFVPLEALRTLWFNTGTLCNVTCSGCYIESSPTNDRLVYLSRTEAQAFLAEARQSYPELAEIGFTGGEPFMNRDLPAMMRDALEAGYRVLVLTNAMRPMQRFAADLAALSDDFKGRITMRVSLDHHSPERHEAVRGAGSWSPAIEGLRFLAGHGFPLAVAGRTLWGEPETAMRAGYQALFAKLDLPLDAFDPAQLVLFPEMDARSDVPEITESCWGILGKQPGEVMCAGSRMVVKRRNSDRPAVVSCTLLPYDEAFELGSTLAEASGTVYLNHRFCAEFCVLGGASCSPT